MNIAGRQIGPGETPYVIAEIGVNHDGSERRALDMVDAAAEAGADAVKLQWFEAERLMSRACRLARYQEEAGERDPVEMLRRLELGALAMARVVERAHIRGMHAIVTVFSLELVEPASALAWDAFKTASPDIIHRPMLEALERDGRPMIVSTGAAEMAEVERAVGWLSGARRADRLALLQCVSSYPCADEDAAIGGVAALADRFGAPTGYSDHTRGVDSGALAVACGACVLEKHLTWSNAAPGPDHAASLEPDVFAEYVALARGACAGRGETSARAQRRSSAGAKVGAGGAVRARAGVLIEMPTTADPRVGPPIKRVLPCERDVRTVSRQSLVTASPLLTGHVLSRNDLTIKRPGTGLAPFTLGDVLGRRLARAVEADMPLTAEDLA